jgi:hypothetical protein
MHKVMEVGPEWIPRERDRLNRLLKGSVEGGKAVQIESRRNALDDFLSRAPGK